ncbi:MAG: hypothetical protein ING59_12580 [Burkholderiales bacterium]|nr:hypothetical protein [Burkholderiales bacterium]
MNYAKALRCRARDAFEALRIAESDVADSQHNVMRLSGEAVAAYARQAKDSELIQYATEIKVRAERRCGELLARTEKNTGARGIGTSAVERCDHTPPTLDDMGLTKDESSRYQQLAAMEAELDVLAVKQAKAQEIGLQAAELLQQINDHNTLRALVDSAAAIGIASGTSR